MTLHEVVAKKGARKRKRQWRIQTLLCTFILCALHAGFYHFGWRLSEIGKPVVFIIVWASIIVVSFGWHKILTEE